MKDQIEQLIHKSQRSFKAGQLLCDNGDYDFAVSRIYYALFYLAEALLLTKNLTFSKHAAVISGFYKNFIKTSIFKKELHKLLHEAFEARQEGDYLCEIAVSQESVQDMIKRSKKFMTLVQAYLKDVLE